MSLTAPSPYSEGRPTGAYRCLRRALRIWFSLNFHHIRVLQAEELAASGPALLVVNHPASFLDALLLIAALDRPIRCFIESALLQRPMTRAWAKGLGFIEWPDGQQEQTSAFSLSCEILRKGGAVLAFAAGQPESSNSPNTLAAAVPMIAIEAESDSPATAPLSIHLIHLHLPVAPSQASEILVHIDRPLHAVDTSDGAAAGQQARAAAFAAEMDRACRENPFRLRVGDLAHFLTGIECAMRQDFEERWTRRPNSKQRVEDFDLSPYLVRLIHHLNYRHPGRLTALCEILRAYQEKRRSLALIALREETAGRWYRSPIRRLAAWVETVIGGPIAAYGLLNLLPAWLGLHLGKSFRRGLWDVPAGVWMVRLIAALACYTGEIVAAALFLPRWAVGYYAPSLLASGAYLLRYLWLLKTRTNVVVASLERKRGERRLRFMRKKLIAEINRDQQRFAWPLKTAR